MKSCKFYRTQWIYDGSDALYPSVYLSEQIAPNDRARTARGRVREAMRLAKQAQTTNRRQVFAYHRYVFTDTKKFLNEVNISSLDFVYF